MDDMVKLAMAKWPKVPHCYGWLALDARGAWRMRDERAQALNLPGDPIRHPALLAFINRNYAADEGGYHYFQNGPQRVYVDIEVAPWIAKLDTQQGMLLHTGDLAGTVEAAWLSDKGHLILLSEGKLTCMDDRDWIHCVDQLRMNEQPLTEQDFETWLHGTPDSQELCWHWQQQILPLGRVTEHDLGSRFGFQTRPRP